jgi:hypothetical protein
MNYMEKVDAWLNELLAEGLGDAEAFKRAVKDKILESYSERPALEALKERRAVL